MYSPLWSPFGDFGTGGWQLCDHMTVENQGYPSFVRSYHGIYVYIVRSE